MKTMLTNTSASVTEVEHLEERERKGENKMRPFTFIIKTSSAGSLGCYTSRLDVTQVSCYQEDSGQLFDQVGIEIDKILWVGCGRTWNIVFRRIARSTTPIQWPFSPNVCTCNIVVCLTATTPL